MPCSKEKVWIDKIITDQKDIHLAGKDSEIPSMGYSLVKAKLVNDNNTVNLTINGVSYVPDLRYNLLSMICLMERGCKIKTGKNCVLIFDKDVELVCKALKNNNRLKLYLEPVT